jgi:glycosyltransferase involved in cell wall biosynthesis
MNVKSVSIVIPAYNEEKNIATTIRNIYKSIPNTEVIVVSDGSTDNTTKVIRNLQRQQRKSNLKIVELKQRTGKGAAILKGFKIAKGKIIGFLDADDAFEIDGIRRMINLLKSEEYDCVIASKWKGTRFSQVKETFLMKIASRIWNILVRLLFGFNFQDTQGGSKFLKKSVFTDIEENFYTKGFEMDVELLWRCLRKGYLVSEVFVPYNYGTERGLDIVDMIGMLVNVLKLRLKGV